MQAMCRIGDVATGTCYSHISPLSVTGHITTGSSNTLCNGIAIGRHGDSVLFNCGHTGTIQSTSIHKCNNLPIAKVTDSVVGPMVANMISGSPNTNVR